MPAIGVRAIGEAILRRARVISREIIERDAISEPKNRKSIFCRIGDSLVTGVGVLIVGALGAFVWYEYKDTVGKLDRAVEELKTARETLEQQNKINGKFVGRLDGSRSRTDRGGRTGEPEQTGSRRYGV